MINKHNNRALYFGSLTGLIGILYYFLPKFSNVDTTPFYRYGFYIIMAFALFIGLGELHRRYKHMFKRGWLFGIKASLITALVLVASNSIAYLINPGLIIHKFDLTATTISGLMIINFIILTEVFIFGNILTFIGLQYYKHPR